MKMTSEHKTGLFLMLAVLVITVSVAALLTSHKNDMKNAEAKIAQKQPMSPIRAKLLSATKCFSIAVMKDKGVAVIINMPKSGGDVYYYSNLGVVGNMPEELFAEKISNVFYEEDFGYKDLAVIFINGRKLPI